MRTMVLGGIRSGKSRWAEIVITESVAPGQPVRYRVSRLAARAGQRLADQLGSLNQRIVALRHRVVLTATGRTVPSTPSET